MSNDPTFTPRLDELGHAYAEDVAWLLLFGRHLYMLLFWYGGIDQSFVAEEVASCRVHLPETSSDVHSLGKGRGKIVEGCQTEERLAGNKNVWRRVWSCGDSFSNLPGPRQDTDKAECSSRGI